MLETTPLSPTFGVDVTGIDLNTVTADHAFAEIRALFEAHSALLFRGQALTDEAHKRIAELFGPIEDRTADERKPGEKWEIPKVSNVRADGSTSAEMDLHTLNLKSNMLWHCDSTFMPVPSLVNILTARVVTTTGGETELASTRAAFADMTPDEQDKLRGLRLKHHYAHSRARISPELAKLPMFNKWPAQTWPAVWKNPQNGAEAVYVASHAFAIEDMEEAEGQALIDDLVETCTQPRYTYSHQWAVGDVLIWDQRAVMHRGTPWPWDQPRTLSSICASVTDADGLAVMRA